MDHFDRLGIIEIFYFYFLNIDIPLPVTTCVINLNFSLWSLKGLPEGKVSQFIYLGLSLYFM